MYIYTYNCVVYRYTYFLPESSICCGLLSKLYEVVECIATVWMCHLSHINYWNNRNILPSTYKKLLLHNNLYRPASPISLAPFRILFAKKTHEIPTHDNGQGTRMCQSKRALMKQKRMIPINSSGIYSLLGPRVAKRRAISCYDEFANSSYLRTNTVGLGILRRLQIPKILHW